jgi:hypothetical protein
MLLLLDKEFDDTSARFSQGLRIAYRILCSTNGYHFLDAGMFGSASPLDGQHLEAGSHRHLALILADCIRRDGEHGCLMNLIPLIDKLSVENNLPREELKLLLGT